MTKIGRKISTNEIITGRYKFVKKEQLIHIFESEKDKKVIANIYIDHQNNLHLISSETELKILMIFRRKYQ